MISILVAVLLQAAAAGGGAEPAEAPVIKNPDWIRRPSGEDFANHYPDKARRQMVTGRALIFCDVDAAGGLVNCKLLEDFPAGFGFGEAALKMSSLFQMSPMTKDGVPAPGGFVRLPIRFVMPGGGVDPLSMVLSCYGYTAAASENEPTNPELISAYTFFASQVALREREARATPKTFEANLSGTREAVANSLKTGGAGNQGLEQCLAAFRGSQKPN